MNNSNNNSKKGYIYLLKMYDENGEVVYRIGRCTNFIDRMNKYLFKNILFTFLCDDYYKTKKKLKNIIKDKYTIKKGYDFFKCDDEDELLYLFITNTLPLLN